MLFNCTQNVLYDQELIDKQLNEEDEKELDNQSSINDSNNHISVIVVIKKLLFTFMLLYPSLLSF